MTSQIETSPVTVPDHIAHQVVTPEGHVDEVRLFEAYAWLRNHAPFAQVHVEGYDPLWLATTQADILEIERQPEIFTNAGGPNTPGSHNPILNTQAADNWTLKNLGSLRNMESMQMMDPPEHTIVRDISAKWFTPKELKKWEDRIRHLARREIRERLPQRSGEFDLVKDFTWYYPFAVIMTLFGVSEGDRPRIMKLAHEHFGGNDPETRRDDIDTDSPAAAAQQRAATIQGFTNYYTDMVYRLREEPQDNLASVIANARQDNGEYFPLNTCIGYYITISGAGHDTTSTTLATCLEHLAKNPDQLKAVQQDLKRIPSLITEALRITSPVKHFVRQAAEDYVLGEHKIRKGDRVMLLFQSANRDEKAFEDADKFIHDRKPNRHIAFGTGPHACLGQSLAKQELRIMLEELLPRIEKLELVGERQVLQTNFVGGLKSRPVYLELSSKVGDNR